MAFPHDGKKFVKGKSGNPAGRPPSLPDLDAVLAKVLSAEKVGGKQAIEKLIEAMVNEGFNGNVPAAKLIIERGYGTVVQKIDQNLNVNSIEVGYGKPDAEDNVQP